ncbi:MAG: LysM peptidoglycan-binding domain-containing protein, partial [Myxococcota bacterium]|nr:LysM peptidoglycan-binding domain-containing protein [Myxococcota bacterium]
MSKGGSKAARLGEGGLRRASGTGPSGEESSVGVESPELRALRAAERELFPQAPAATGTAWPSELLALPRDGEPEVRASGVPAGIVTQPLRAEGANDVSWLAQLEMPDLPVRWDERVVRYLQFFRDDPRGHATFANLFRRSGRFRDMMRRVLRRKSLPEDLVWLSMIESGFDPVAHSSSGAAGLWQFMPETGRLYGLTTDRWIDLRYSAELATVAASDLLGDLHRRFGSWELALAAYNMGNAGLSSVVRRYNTNDFWSLARTEGAIPWETALYVPKILAASVVAHNLSAFGFGDLVADVPVETDHVDVPPGTSLSLVAQAAGCDPKEIEALNPEFRAARTPPASDVDTHYQVNVPQGKGATLTQALARLRKDQAPFDRYVTRFGESLEQVAATHKTTTQRLVELNAMAPGEAVRGGTVLLVPRVDAPPSGTTDRTTSAGPRPSVVVPSDEFVYPDRRRVFYRVLAGDTLREIASAMNVSMDELCRWNDLDPGARLQDGMTLQGFVAPGADLSGIVVAPEADVNVVAVGTDEFFALLEQQGKGFKRVTVAAKAGDTLESIGKRFDVSGRTMERINRRGRSALLKPGEMIVVYAPSYVTAPSMRIATA